MSNVFDYKAEISKLEEAIDLKQISPGGALALLGLKMHEHFAGQLGGAAPVRVSFRKNVQIEPYKYEHAEVWVDLNGSSLQEATQIAKDSCDEVLGVNVEDEDVTYALDVIRKAKKAGKLEAHTTRKPGRAERTFDQDLEDALRWGK